jgi:hypothetical protein
VHLFHGLLGSIRLFLLLVLLFGRVFLVFFFSGCVLRILDTLFLNILITRLGVLIWLFVIFELFQDLGDLLLCVVFILLFLVRGLFAFFLFVFIFIVDVDAEAQFLFESCGLLLLRHRLFGLRGVVAEDVVFLLFLRFRLLGPASLQ